MPTPPPAPPARLEFIVTNFDQLPAEYLIIRPNEEALRKLADSWREGDPVPCLSGVRFNIFTPAPTPCPINPRKRRPALRS